MRVTTLALAVLGALAPNTVVAAPLYNIHLEPRLPPPIFSLVGFVNRIEIPGDATDRSGKPKGANGNRLGAFGSDLAYDAKRDIYYALPDRGPGGGVISYETRFHTFSLKVDKKSGAISNFNLKSTVMLKDRTTKPFNGLNPEELNGSPSVLGNSLDPEGIVPGKSGHIFISDEYGPTVRAFTPSGKLVRTFESPSTVIPRLANGKTDYVADYSSLASGRQDNRGFEGLARSPDGTKMFAMLQDPLDEEGSTYDGKPQGRYGRYIRIVEFLPESGKAGRQFFYELEPYKMINSRLSKGATTYGRSAQGRHIGISAMVAISNTQFLVLERDNRGIGIDDPLGKEAVGTKRIYLIDIASASDVRSFKGLKNNNTLPTAIKAVSKTLAVDIQAELTKAKLTIPEKMEGLAIGPRLDDGSFLLLVSTDNDFSVTQNDNDVQLDVCADGRQVKLDSGCGANKLLPSYLYAFKVKIPGYLSPANM